MSKEIVKSTGAVSGTNEGKPGLQSPFDEMKAVFLGLCEHRYSESGLRELKAKLDALQIGGMYYWGYSNNVTTYIIDGCRQEIFKRKPTEYYLVCREFDYESNSFRPLDNKRSEIALDEFLENLILPRLTKSPGELRKEAEQALESGNIDSYQLSASHNDDSDGPNTELIHLGSKENLDVLAQSLRDRKDHIELIEFNMSLIISQKQRKLEKIKDRLTAAIQKFEKQIQKVQRVITTLELYLGISEDLTQIQAGEPAGADAPVTIRQGLLYMDEEIGDPSDDGQGLERDQKGLAAFDTWLTRHDNYKKVAPEEKSIIAFQARRNQKERFSLDGMERAIKAELDNTTFLLIRNGDNLYRIITDKISFRPRLFPKRNELQELFNFWTFVEQKRKKDAAQDDSFFHRVDEKTSEQLFPGLRLRYQDFRTYADAKEFAEDNVFFYKIRWSLFQGLFDRTTVFHPLPGPIKLFDHSAINEGRVRLIFDDEVCLPSHRLPFWSWIARLNSTIDYGSRIVLSHNFGFLREFNHRYAKPEQVSDERALHSERLDERYGDGSRWSHLPPLPPPGLYYVKKGERTENQPVWIDNPWYDADRITTADERYYCPEYRLDQMPSNKKGYYKTKKFANSCHINSGRPCARLTYSKQIEYFGKVVEKAWGPNMRQDADVNGVWIYSVVKNPKRIHKYHFDGDGEPVFEFADVKINFPCIRYNPKDKVGEFNLFRSWRDMDSIEERKVNLSWKIDPKHDGFIINYDALTVEDIDFYINSRIDRREYVHLMPLLAEVKKQLLNEQASEVDFKRLVSGEVLKLTGREPLAKDVDAAVEAWKKNLKWKRAIHHDDQKALRMIVKRLLKISN